VKINFVQIEIDYRPEFKDQFSQFVPTGMPCGNYRSLYSVQKAVYSIKKALDSINRALYSVKRAVHSIKRALSSIKRALHSSQKRLCLNIQGTMLTIRAHWHALWQFQVWGGYD